MATQAYWNWVNAGRPWKVAQPVKAVGDRLRAHGYTVYYLGNEEHQTANIPEDHSPFSATGWPAKHPYPYVNAMDIMPPTAGQKSNLDGRPLPTLQQLGRALRADKNADHAGVRWLKYMNWEPEGNYTGPCYHDSWQPNYQRMGSGDRGHIHVSGRSDFVTSTTADGYDLVARARGESSTPPQGEAFMAALTDAQQKDMYDRQRRLEDALARVEALATNANNHGWAAGQLLTTYPVIPGSAPGARPVTVGNPLAVLLRGLSDDADIERVIAAVRDEATRVTAALAGLPAAVRAEVEAELAEVGGGLDGAVVQAATERALTRLRITVDPQV